MRPMVETTPTATIVVVEDEPAIADALAVRLRAEGFAVEVAHDGPRGVELCERVQPRWLGARALRSRRSGVSEPGSPASPTVWQGRTSRARAHATRS